MVGCWEVADDMAEVMADGMAPVEVVPDAQLVRQSSTSNGWNRRIAAILGTGTGRKHGTHSSTSSLCLSHAMGMK